MTNEMGDVLFDKEDKSQRQRAYDGSSIMPGILIGTITNNFNPLFPDKVQVEIPIGGQQSKTLVWAKVMTPAAGSSWGLYYVPETGDKVIVAFVAGNMHKPFILGCAYKKSSSMISENRSLLNNTKKLKTKAGGELSFENSLTGEMITIKTKKNNQVVIDDKNDTITIKTGKGNNLIKINGTTGAIEITSDNSISIGTGQAKIELKKSGSVDVTCRDFNVKNKANINLDGNKVAVSGTQVEIKSAGNANINATGPLKMQSSAVLEAKGTMVKIN